jgi:NAD(P)-dependent dehydrogenase (short-subunit alcohol dehydrogenase family)
MNSKKKIALVTGGNRGFGFETCHQLAEGIVLNGFELVLLEKHKHNGTDVISSNKKIPMNRRTY